MSNRHVGAVIFDADGTMFRRILSQAWVDEMVRLGLFPRIVIERCREVRRAYKHRRGPFDAWADAQVSAYTDRIKGVRVDDAKFAAESVVRRKGHLLYMFPRDLCATAKDLGMQRGIISGSMCLVVEAFARLHDIPIAIGTELKIKHGIYTGEIVSIGNADKRKTIHALALKYGFDLVQSVAVGDAMSDAAMLEVVGHPICFNPTRQLVLEAGHQKWPLVLEFKNSMHFFRQNDGRMHEVQLEEILPEAIAVPLLKRLTDSRRESPSRPMP